MDMGQQTIVLVSLISHLASNEDRHHGEAVATSGGMGLVWTRSIQRKGDPSMVLAKAAVDEFSKIL